MTVNVDGARSRRRIWDAMRKIRIIADLDLPAISGSADGFQVKVWQMNHGELSGGNITAPFGIFVTLSNEDGIRHFTYDSSSCAALPAFLPADKDSYVLLSTTADSILWGQVSGGDATAVMVKNNPAPLQVPAQVSCSPFGGEYVVTSMCSRQVSTSNIHTSPAAVAHGRWVNSAQLSHCDSNGVGDKDLLSYTSFWEIVDGVSSFTFADLNPLTIVPMKVIPGFYEYLEWKQQTLYVTDSSGWGIVATYVYVYGNPKTVTRFNIITTWMYIGAPTYFTNKLLGGTGNLYPLIAGAFFRRIGGNIPGAAPINPPTYPVGTPTGNLMGVVAVHTPVFLVDASDAEYDDPTDAHVRSPEREWYNFLYFFDWVAGDQVVTRTALNAILMPLVTGDSELGWVQSLHLEQDPALPSDFTVGRAMGALFGWPANTSFNSLTYYYPYGIPHGSKTQGVVRDTATFSTAAGVVHSWLRCTDPGATQNPEGLIFTGTRLGGFRFDKTTGIERVTIVVPPVVLTDTTLRPRIMLLTETTYVCIVDREVGDFTNFSVEITGLFVGSPFTVWSEIVMPVGVTMYSIKAILAGDTADESGFIGVGKEVVLGVTTYYSYMKMKTSGWSRLGSIPAGTIVDATARWDSCVFGDDGVVSSSMGVQQFPIASPSRHDVFGT